MNQEEIRQHVQHVQVVAQKVRSNVVHVVGDPADEKMAEMIAPGLFGKVNVLDVATRLLERDHISGGNLYNLLFLVHRSDLMMAMFELSYPEWTPPSPDPRWIVQIPEDLS